MKTKHPWQCTEKESDDSEVFENIDSLNINDNHIMDKKDKHKGLDYQTKVKKK